MASVLRSMRSSTVRAGIALGLVLLLSACAQRPGEDTGDAGGSSTPPSSDAPSLPDDGGLVLEVAYTGGFVAPEMQVGRLPLVAVYADGRVITQGPVAAIHPGPATPNLQVQHLEADEVQELVEQALAAGVGDDVDYGMPTVADAPSTRFTLVTGEGTETAEVYALSESLSPGPRGDEPLPGLTEEQVAARGQLNDLLESVTLAGTSDTATYEPEAVAAIATEWTPVDDGLPPPEPVAWPGPPLPGEALDPRLGVHCVSARAEAAQSVLEAARTATTATPWTSADGTPWALTLRPLLPHESGCDDLTPT